MESRLLKSPCRPNRHDRFLRETEPHATSSASHPAALCLDGGTRASIAQRRLGRWHLWTNIRKCRVWTFCALGCCGRRNSCSLCKSHSPRSLRDWCSLAARGRVRNWHVLRVYGRHQLPAGGLGRFESREWRMANDESIHTIHKSASRAWNATLTIIKPKARHRAHLHTRGVRLGHSRGIRDPDVTSRYARVPAASLRGVASRCAPGTFAVDPRFFERQHASWNHVGQLARWSHATHACGRPRR